MLRVSVILFVCNLGHGMLLAENAPVFYNSSDSTILASPAQLYQVLAQRLEVGLGSEATRTSRWDAALQGETGIESVRYFARAAVMSRYPRVSRGVVMAYAEGGAGHDAAANSADAANGARSPVEEEQTGEGLKGFRAGVKLAYSPASFFSLGLSADGARHQEQTPVMTVFTRDSLNYTAGGLIHFSQFEFGAGLIQTGFVSVNESQRGGDDVFLRRRSQVDEGRATSFAHLRAAVDAQLALGARYYVSAVTDGDGNPAELRRVDWHAEVFIESVKIEALRGIGQCNNYYVGYGSAVSTCENLGFTAMVAFDGGTTVGAHLARSDARVVPGANAGEGGPRELAMRRDSMHWTATFSF